MAILNTDDLKFKYNNPSTGLYKDQLNNEIEAKDDRANTEDIADSFLNYKKDYEKYIRQATAPASGTNAYSVSLDTPTDPNFNLTLFILNFGVTSTGPVTLAINGAAPLKMYKDNTTQADANDILEFLPYMCRFQQSLDSGAGGYILISGGGAGGGDTNINLTARGIWEFNNTLVPPPTTGRVRFDSATLSTVTNLYIHQTSDEAVDAGYFFSTLTVGDQVFIQSKSDATRWMRAKVRLAPTDNGAWWTIPVTVFQDSGVMILTTQKCIVRFNQGGGAADVTADAIRKTINKTAHGFIPGDVLTVGLAGGASIGVLVKVTNGSTNEITGIVTEVIDADHYVMTIDGYVTIPSADYSPGQIFYAADNGTYTLTPPRSDSKKVLIATSTTSAYMVRDGAVILPAESTSWKNPVDVATTANIALTGEQTIDGMLTANSRVLVKDQSSKAQNGMYLSSAGAWTRTTDADINTELYGAAVNVLNGTANGTKNFVQITNPITLGTTAVVWTQLTGASTPVGAWSQLAPGIVEESTQVEAEAIATAAATAAGTAGLSAARTPSESGMYFMLSKFISLVSYLKANALFSTTVKTGGYTLAAADLTAINKGESYIAEGNNTGDLTIPPNATVAFPIGTSFGVRGFANVVAGAGVTITGTNGTLAISAGRTVVVEKTGANAWLLHNGAAQVTTWSTAEVGIVEESTQVEAEAIANGASVASTGGLSQTRTPSEIGLYYFIRKVFTLGWTFSIGPTITDATASTIAFFDGAKRLVSIAYATAAEIVAGTDATKPINSAALNNARTVKRGSAILSGGVVTLDCANKDSLRLENVTPLTANHSIALSNETVTEYLHYTFYVTGTITITLPSNFRHVDKAGDLRWTAGTLALTLAGGTAEPFNIFIWRITGSKFQFDPSWKGDA